VLAMALEDTDRSADGSRLKVGRLAGQVVIDVLVPSDAAVGVKLELVGGAR